MHQPPGQNGQPTEPGGNNGGQRRGGGAGGLGFLVLGALKWSWLRTWWATHHIHACAVIANRVIFSRSRGPAVVILSLAVHVLAVVVAWCVVQSIAAPVGFSDVFVLVPPVMLITMMPISIAGWGVREATMSLAFGFAMPLRPHPRSHLYFRQ